MSARAPSCCQYHSIKHKTQAGGEGANGFLENACIKITSKLYYYQDYRSTNIYTAVSECSLMLIYISTVMNTFMPYFKQLKRIIWWCFFFLKCTLTYKNEHLKFYVKM